MEGLSGPEMHAGQKGDILFRTMIIATTRGTHRAGHLASRHAPSWRRCRTPRDIRAHRAGLNGSGAAGWGRQQVMFVCIPAIGGQSLTYRPIGAFHKCGVLCGVSARQLRHRHAAEACGTGSTGLHAGMVKSVLPDR